MLIFCSSSILDPGKRGLVFDAKWIFRKVHQKRSSTIAFVYGDSMKETRHTCLRKSSAFSNSFSSRPFERNLITVSPSNLVTLQPQGNGEVEVSEKLNCSNTPGAKSSKSGSLFLVLGDFFLDRFGDFCFELENVGFAAPPTSTLVKNEDIPCKVVIVLVFVLVGGF